MWYVCEVVSLCSILYFLVDGRGKKKTIDRPSLKKAVEGNQTIFFFLPYGLFICLFVCLFSVFKGWYLKEK